MCAKPTDDSNLMLLSADRRKTKLSPVPRIGDLPVVSSLFWAFGPVISHKPHVMNDGCRAMCHTSGFLAEMDSDS